MKYQEVAVHTPLWGVELISMIFTELGSGGVAIDDPALFYKYAESGKWDYWIAPAKTDPEQMPVVKGYFPADSAAEKIEQLREKIGKLDLADEVKIYIREVQEEDWATAWQAYYKPIKVGKRFLVKPTWENAVSETKRIVLELDPGMAFGCGNHPTTTMCLELMEDLISGGEEVCDVGTGTGILAIAAAKLGAAKVFAVDLDEVAVKTAKNNARLNGVDDKLNVVHGNLLDCYQGTPDLITANIIADVIIDLAPDAQRLLKQGGRFIASGIIKDRAEEVLSVLRANNFALKDTREQGEWVAYLLQKE